MPVKIIGIGKVQARLNELARKYDKKGSLRVGFLENATYPDGTSVAMVAAIQEFGAPSRNIPPRPFFRNMIAAKSKEWPEALAKILEIAPDVKMALSLVGEGIAGQLRQSIIDTNEPPLSEVTLMLRKMRQDDPDLIVTGKIVGEAAAKVKAGQRSGLSGTAAKPLVDTGNMLNSISYEVE